MPYFFLAHGSLGVLDELFPFLFGLGLIILLIVAAYISRKNPGNTPPEAPPPERQEKSPDHFRLD